MKRIKTIISAVALTLSASLCGCGSPEKDALEAKIEAAQIEGREAAREFVNREWKDTMELQNRLLEVRSMQSKYEEENAHEAAAAFDTAFVSTLRTVRPDIARELDKKSPAVPVPSSDENKK